MYFADISVAFPFAPPSSHVPQRPSGVLGAAALFLGGAPGAPAAFNGLISFRVVHWRGKRQG